MSARVRLHEALRKDPTLAGRILQGTKACTPRERKLFRESIIEDMHGPVWVQELLLGRKKARKRRGESLAITKPKNRGVSSRDEGGLPPAW